MAFRQLSHEDVSQSVHRYLCLPQDVRLTGEEGLASLLRAIVELRAPIDRAGILSLAVEISAPLFKENGHFQKYADVLVDTLIEYGDVLLPDEFATGDNEARSALIYPAPPGFLVRKGGMVFIRGIFTDDFRWVWEKIASRVRYKGHVRFLSPEVGEDLPKYLKDCGLQSVPTETFLSRPPEEARESFLAQIDKTLNDSAGSGSVADFTWLAGSPASRNWNERWTDIAPSNGVYVVRRSRRFGSALWGIARMSSGRLTHLLNLPTKSGVRACDEAWRVQAALDAARGSPPLIYVKHEDGRTTVSTNRPFPAWVTRRWDLFGSKINRPGFLMSYSFSPKDAGEEVAFVSQFMWAVTEE